MHEYRRHHIAFKIIYMCNAFVLQPSHLRTKQILFPTNYRLVCNWCSGKLAFDILCCITANLWFDIHQWTRLQANCRRIGSPTRDNEKLNIWLAPKKSPLIPLQTTKREQVLCLRSLNIGKRW